MFRIPVTTQEPLNVTSGKRKRGNWHIERIGHGERLEPPLSFQWTIYGGKLNHSTGITSQCLLHDRADATKSVVIASNDSTNAVTATLPLCSLYEPIANLFLILPTQLPIVVSTGQYISLTAVAGITVELLVLEESVID